MNFQRLALTEKRAFLKVRRTRSYSSSSAAFVRPKFSFPRASRISVLSNSRMLMMTSSLSTEASCSDSRLSGYELLALRRLCGVWPPELIGERRFRQMSHRLAACPDALAILRQALRFAPDAPDAHERLGHALRLAGLLQESVAAYCVALIHAGPVARIVGALASAMERGGALAEAAHFFEFAAALEPWCSEHRVGLARSLVSDGDRERAIWLLLAIVRERPRDAACVPDVGPVRARPR